MQAIRIQIRSAAAGDEQAADRLIAKVLQLRWMGRERQAARLSARLRRALGDPRRDDRRLLAAARRAPAMERAGAPGD